MTIQTQFIFDDDGKKIGAIIPIEDYNKFIQPLKGDELTDIPEWHKKILDERRDNYAKDPESYINARDFRKTIMSKLNK